MSLTRLNRELKESRKPVLGFWFSLTSHAPYHLPDQKYRTTPRSDPDHDFIDTLKYSDEALGRFFEQASQEDYFPNTIFIILADHTAGSELRGAGERHHLPCLIYAPALIPPKRVASVGSQIDLLPTVLDLIEFQTDFVTFGKSLWSEAPGPRFAFLDRGGMQGWIEQDHLLLLVEDHLSGVYSWPHDLVERHNLLKESQSGLDSKRDNALSFIQVSKRLIRDNKLAPYPSRPGSQ